MPYIVPVIRRREPVQTILGDFVKVSGRFGEEIAPQEAPDPIRRTRFNTRRAKMFLAAYVNPAQMFQQIDEMLGRKYHDVPLASVPEGRQRSWRERSNIRRPEPQAYGSQFEV